MNSNKAIVQLRKDRIAGLHVRAGIDGQLQSMDLELGQWINSGTELARVAQPGRFKAVLRVPESQAKDVVVGQNVDVDLHQGDLVKGRVMRVDPISQNATVEVEVSLDGAMPQGARSDLSVDGTIEIDRLADVLYVQRPGNSQPDQTVGLFKLEPDGKTAVRTNVKFGKASVNHIGGPGRASGRRQDPDLGYGSVRHSESGSNQLVQGQGTKRRNKKNRATIGWWFRVMSL